MHTINRTAALSALAAVTLLTSCTDNGSQATPAPSSSEDAAGTESAVEPDYTIIGDAHLTGPGRWAIPTFGVSDTPLAVLDVPEGFQGSESWIWTDLQGPRQFGQLAYWAPTRVPSDPCDLDASPPLGPTSADLAAALAEQERTTTSEPAPIAVDGHRGLYLELTTPARFDYEDCAPGGGMQIWEVGGRGDGRILDEPVTDRYWILDVDGRRVVISAMTTAHGDKPTVELLTGLVEGIRFVEAG